LLNQPATSTSSSSWGDGWWVGTKKRFSIHSGSLANHRGLPQFLIFISFLSIQLTSPYHVSGLYTYMNVSEWAYYTYLKCKQILIYHLPLHKV
jgi:hypothetical protein